MTEELKRAIAKTLLITQLFSPINIKFVTNTYKEHNEITKNQIVQFNDFVIEKTNPFNEQNITFEPELLLYENREEAIEELMKSVHLNLKITSKTKQNINCIRNFLKDNPHIDLETLYNLLGKLKIRRVNTNETYAMRTSWRGTVNYDDQSGIILPYKATINLNNVKLNDFNNDEVFFRSFFHELVHLSGWFNTYDETKCIGSGLTEGMTSLIEYDYYGELAGYESYFFLRTCTKLLAELIGEDKFLQCFSNRSLLSLQLELQALGIQEINIKQLIMNLDIYNTYYSEGASIEKIKLVTKEVISFFEEYENLIENDTTKYIYNSYIEDLKSYQYSLSRNINPTTRKNTIQKIYYNKEALKENPNPYFMEHVFFENLEYISYPYTIIEKDLEKEILTIKVLINDEFINSIKGKHL